MSKHFLYGSIKYGVGVEPLASYITFLHEDKLSSSDDDNDEHINELLALHRDLSTLNKNISPIPDDILKSKRRRKSFCSEGEEEVYKAIEKKEPCKIQFCDPNTVPDHMWVQKVLVDDASGISDSDEDRSSIGDVKNDIKLQQDSKTVKSRAYKKDINASKFFTTGLLVNDNKHQVSLSSTSSLSSLEQKHAKMKSEKFERRKNKYRIRDTTKRNRKKTGAELTPRPLSPISCEPPEQFESPAMQMTPPPYFSKSLPMQSYLMESPPFNMVPPMSLTSSYTSPNYAVKSLTQIPFPINSSVIEVPSSSFPTNLSPSKALSFTDNSSLSDIMSLFNANSSSSENQHSSEISNSLNTATSEIAPTLLTANSPSLEISSMLAEIPSSFHSNSSFELPPSSFAAATKQTVQNSTSFPLTSSSLEMSYQPIKIPSLYAVNIPQIGSMFTVNSPKQITSASSVNVTSNAANSSSMTQMIPTTFSSNSLHQITQSFATDAEISSTINEAESVVALPAMGKSQNRVRPSSSSPSSYGTLNSLIEISGGTVEPCTTAAKVIVQLTNSGAATESSAQIFSTGVAKPRKRTIVRSCKKNANASTTEMFAASPFTMESRDDISFSTAVESMSATSSSSSHKKLLQSSYSGAMNELMDRSAANAETPDEVVRSFGNALMKPMQISTSLSTVNPCRRIRSFKKSANASMAELFSTSPYTLEQSCGDVPDSIGATTAESVQLSAGDSLPTANRQKKKIRSSYDTMNELIEKSNAFAYGVETSDEVVHSAGSDTIESLQESSAAGSMSSLKSRRRLPSSKNIADETSEIFSAAPLFARNSCNADESITQMPSDAKLCEMVSSSDNTIDELMEMLNTSVASCEDDILSSDNAIGESVQISTAPSPKSSAKIIRSFGGTVNESLDMYAAAVESCAEIRNSLLEPVQVSSSCAAPSMKPRKRVVRSAKHITNESTPEIFTASSFTAVGPLSEIRSSNNPTQMCSAGFPTGIMNQSESSIRFSSNTITNGSPSSEMLFPADSCNEMRNIEPTQQMSHATSSATGSKAHRRGVAGRCYNSGTYESTQMPTNSSSAAKSRKRINNNNNNKTQPIQMLSFYDLDESLQTSSSFNMLNQSTVQMSQSFVLNELSHAYNGANQSESSSYNNMVNRLVQIPSGSPTLKQSSSQISSPYNTVNQLVQIMPSVTGKRTSQASSAYNAVNQTVKIAPAKPLDSSNHHPVKIAPSLQKKLSYTMNRSVQTTPSSNVNAVPKHLTSSIDQMVVQPSSRTVSSSNNILNELSKKYTPLKPKELPKIYKPLSAAAAQKEAKRKVMQAQAKRKKMWAIMNKKEICKLQRSRGNKLREVQTQLRKVSHQCAKQFKQKALQSQRNAKEAVWRAKRLTKEMHVYWKRYDRVERENKRRLEKEAEEQRKMDVELFEVKRQQRKLNFLITQTELYAHFMSRKLGQNDSADPSNILSQLDEERGEYLYYDTYDSESLKEQVRQNVLLAFQADKVYSNEVGKVALSSDTVLVDEDRPQPKFFQGVLKHYQLKGMNWIANLYDQGINGILADEMGLGKTVQTIAFLCHITEKYNIWGPFLIITPSSTLHNWQQEFARFAPIFKVVPYWGNLQERKILRQFWELKDIHTQNASFHVVITNYQLVVTDIKYLNKIEWQYLVLDEAQAIKSANSQRWKMLLEFKCRNRLLLSGTPIQNNMAELWALLHFIMPSMFDSHDEFNEWFSKDIESHAENKTNIDEKHLNRLRMILKPFMLRRIKKDVENELSDKMEIMVYCPLTSRQKMLYSVLKKKIRIEDLLHGTQYSQLITSKLMNLVMQFRKVCNHPELFERREPSSPAFINNEEYTIPKLVFNECIINLMFPGQQHIYNKFNIFSTYHINSSLFSNLDGGIVNSSFSFSRFISFSPSDINRIVFDGILGRWIYYLWLTEKKELLRSYRVWEENQNVTAKSTMLLCDLKKIASKLIFRHNATNKFIYSFGSVTYRNMPETMEHRLMRSIKANGCFTMSNYRSIELYDSIDSILENSLPDDVTLLPEFRFIDRGAVLYKCKPLYLPSFLFKIYPKAVIQLRVPYCCSRRFVSYVDNLHTFNSEESYNYIWYGHPTIAKQFTQVLFNPIEVGGLEELTQTSCKSNIDIPDKQTLVTDSGKLSVLDGLLKQLKEGGHRVLIYSQMTKMIDILEEYMVFRKHRYMRLDGTSKISERRDMVQDFQTRSDIFVFLLSTRAGGVGINLTAADTVVFYDSDWNPTVDEQAMDRAHRLGQTKQVTVYRLICKDSIEERILQRAQEKSAIQRIVISGESMKADILKPKEVVSLLLDDEEIERKYREKQLERRLMLEQYHTEDNNAETNNEEEEIVQVEVVHGENDSEGNDKGEVGIKTKRNEKDNDEKETDGTEIKNDKLENNKKENAIDIKNNGAENGRYTMEEHNYSLPIDNLIVEEYADLELCIQEEVIEQELPDNVIEIYTNSDTPSPEVVVIPPPFSNKYIRKRGRPPLKNRSERPIPAKKPKLPIKSDPTTRRGRGRPRLHRPSGLSSRNTQSSPLDHNFHVWPEDN